ncbi:cytochrome P450, partial [Frankia sp. CpI1-P]
GGTALPTGAVLELNLAAANRDPERWDAPDLFDLDRVQRRHVGFSAGPHTCLGTHVARAQLQLAATILFDRLPKLRLKDSGPPPRIIGLEHRCPTRILVTC